jgi:hypothetical protein
MLKNVLRLTLPSLLVIFLILELTVTILIPASQYPYYYYDPDDHILRFSMAEQREGVYTIGPLSQRRAKWRINNAGWNSAIDFVETKHKPRIAIIGDSFVEAFQVDVGDSLAGQLRQKLSPDVDVYRFGISGAPLSQYLQMARYVIAHFDPDILVVNVVHNDFSESLCSVESKVGMLCLEHDGNAIHEAPIIPYEPNPVFRIARRINLIRFLVTNLKAPARLQRLFSSMGTTPIYNANIDVERVRAQRGQVKTAVDYVLRALKRESSGRPVVFIMDAPRKDIYANTLNQSDVRWLNELLRHKTLQYGFTFIDLTDAFARIFESEHVRLDVQNDGHWNERGHEAAAQALHTTLVRHQLLTHLSASTARPSR